MSKEREKRQKLKWRTIDMKIRKLTAAAAAMAAALSAVSISAFADNEQTALLAEKIEGRKGVQCIGNGLYFYDNGEANGYNEFADIDGFFRIGDKELEQWRKTGKLTPTEVTCDVDLTDRPDVYVNPSEQTFNGGFIDKSQNYFQIGDGYALRGGVDGIMHNIEKYHTVKYDENAASITTVRSEEVDWSCSRKDGYTVSMQRLDDGVVVTVTSPDGKSVKKEFKLAGYDAEFGVEPWYNVVVSENDDYVAYMAWATEINTLGKPYIYYDIYGFDKSGNVKTLYSVKDMKVESLQGTQCNGVRSFTAVGDNTITWQHQSNSGFRAINILNTKTGELTENYMPLSAEEGAIPAANTVNVVSPIYDGKAVAEYWNSETFTNEYVLIDIKPQEDGKTKEYSKYYKHMSSHDGGKTFLVQTMDDKWGFIDANGKELAVFDDAGNFHGNYAPVVKDGKGYLVDKNMNKVTGEIDATGCQTMSDEVFRFTNGDDVYLAAAAVGDTQSTTPAEPSKPAAKPVDYSDDTTGIKATANEGVIADGAKLSAAAVADKTNDKNFTYEISFKKDDKNVQPNGKVTVKIPVPEAIKDKTIYVYRVEDGKYYDMGAKVENGFVVFETDHFSEYLVTTEKNENAVKPTNPATGIAGGMFSIMAIAGAFVIVSKKRR